MRSSIALGGSGRIAESLFDGVDGVGAGAEGRLENVVGEAGAAGGEEGVGDHEDARVLTGQRREAFGLVVLVVSLEVQQALGEHEE